MLPIKPRNITAVEIDLPGSKSETHRMLIMGGLNKGKTVIQDPLWCDDTEVTLNALQVMGMKVERTQREIRIYQPIGNAEGDSIQLKDSGSSARFLVPLAGFTNAPLNLSGSKRLHQRPMKQLFEILKRFGAKIEDSDGHLPARIFPGSLTGGEIAFEKLPSSQYISALMMVAPLMEKPLTIHLGESIPSFPYIDLTASIMRDFSIPVELDDRLISVQNRLPSADITLRVGKDMSAASYWVVLGLIHGAEIRFKNLHLPSRQGDEFVFQVAEEMGAEIKVFQNEVLMRGKIEKGFHVDCYQFPDIVPSLSILGLFSPEPCTISNIAHLRYKESDRIEAILKNIKTIGGNAEYIRDELRIAPGSQFKPGIIESFNDHRIAMSFAIAGTRIDGITIDNPACVAKSYPGFWDQLSRI